MKKNKKLGLEQRLDELEQLLDVERIEGWPLRSSWLNDFEYRISCVLNNRITELETIQKNREQTKREIMTTIKWVIYITVFSLAAYGVGVLLAGVC